MVQHQKIGTQVLESSSERFRIFLLRRCHCRTYVDLNDVKQYVWPGLRDR